jgi:hypothetical protein
VRVRVLGYLRVGDTGLPREMELDFRDVAGFAAIVRVTTSAVVDDDGDADRVTVDEDFSAIAGPANDAPTCSAFATPGPVEKPPSSR